MESVIHRGLVFPSIKQVIFEWYLKFYSLSNVKKFCYLLNVVGLYMVLHVLVLQLIDISLSTYFTHYTLAEETAYTYTSAYNYLKYGFLNSGLLQDFSASPDPLDHPFVYNHMPPGPDLFLGVLLKIFNNSVQITKAFYALVAAVGFIYYFRFVNMLLSKINFPVGGLALIITGPYIIIGIMERQIYSFLPLFMFLPYLSLMSYYRNNKRVHLYIALSTVFLSSIYLEYSVNAGILFCWAMIYMTRLLPIKTKHFLLVALAMFSGVLLHLIQNFLFFGPELFFQEFFITISNRITGFPQQDEIRQFYESSGIVHHGSKPVQIKKILNTIQINFSIIGVYISVASGVLLFIYTFLDKKLGARKIVNNLSAKYLGWYTFRMWLFISMTLLGPILVFPAFAQEVSLIGMGLNRFILGIGITCIVGIFFKVIPQLIAIIDDFAVPNLVRSLALTIFSVLLAIILFNLLLDGKRTFDHVSITMKSENWSRELLDLKQFSNKFYITNINVTTPSLITDSVGLGVCSPDVITSGGDILTDECKVCFAKQRKIWEEKRPKYFFYFTDGRLFPGFADCLPVDEFDKNGTWYCMDELRSRLERNYSLVFSNNLVKVYDLDRKF